MATHMYAKTKTWNPFQGCEFDCTYCGPTFKAQAKRQMHNCRQCYQYSPHVHPDRLKKIPSAETVFVCGNADIAFCDPGFTIKILEAIRDHNARCPDKTYYLQSKRPKYLDQFLKDLPGNVVLVTTLETNRDAGYGSVSKAPPPSERFKQFLALKNPRKVVTIEPVMDFDTEVFSRWMIDLQPEYVWLGFNSHSASAPLPEPSEAKMQEFVRRVSAAGIPIKGKKLKGMDLPEVERTQE